MQHLAQLPRDQAGSRTDARPGTSMQRITLGAAALAAMLRLALIARAHEPGVVPDEPGYWSVARWVTGGTTRIHMLDMPVYQPVHGLLLAPVELLPLDPTGRYRLALVLAFVAVLASAVLARHVVAHMGGGATAVTAAFVLVVLNPATLFTSSFTWSEPTVLLWTFAFVAVLAHLTTGYRPVPMHLLLAGSTLAGSAPFLHGRLVLFIPIWLMLVVWAWNSRTPEGARRSSTLHSTCAVVLTIATALACAALRSAAHSALYDGGRSAGDATLSTLSDPTRWGNILLAATGQLWYAIVASAGLAVLGVIALTRLVRSSTHRPFAIGVLAVIGSVWIVSASFMGHTVGRVVDGETAGLVAVRWDHLTYGRYIDPVVLVAAVAGLWVVVGRWDTDRPPERGPKSSTRALRRQFGWVAALVAVLGVSLVALWSGADLAGAVAPNVAAVSALGISHGTAGVLLATGVSMALIALLAGTCGDLRYLIGSGALVLALWTVGAGLAAGSFHRSMGFGPLYRDVPTAEPGHRDAVVARDARLDRTARFNWPGQQMMLGDSGWTFEFSELDSDALVQHPPPGTGLIATRGSTPPTDGGAEWTEVGSAGAVTLWHRAG